MNELTIDDIPYGVVECSEDGNILYKNQIAISFLSSKDQSVNTDNILSHIDDSYVARVKNLLINKSGCDFIKLKDDSNTYFKILVKQSTKVSDHIIIMICDCKVNKCKYDLRTFQKLNDDLTRNTLVLKTISNICNNVFCKNRSDLDDIIKDLSKIFRLKKSIFCFRNGITHVIYSNKTINGYEIKKIDGGKEIQSNCPIWRRVIGIDNSDELLFKVSRGLTCFSGNENIEVNILKLKLSNNKVVGFFEFIEDDNFKLSHTELEILESLSQILAFIINNKEETLETSNYIREKFSKLTSI